jgi:endonuclease YncB( thermonuclease family)
VVSLHQQLKATMKVLPAVFTPSLVFVALLVAGLLTGCGKDDTPEAPGSRQFLDSARAMSGDSLEVFLPNRTAAAIIGIEAPPGNTACGEQSRAMLARLIVDGVTLEQTPALDFDDLGRRLYFAFSATGESIALRLLQEGLAKTSPVSHKYEPSYKAAEEDARSAVRGCVWATS